jgi:hypothetical protein
MANPTSNFGWQMPTPVDLVTDLPADFEVFGQAVDSSLADLKGGTSGQVLSKNSNTDMDFVWVTSDDANAIQNSIVDAKGDLITATANDTPARLATAPNDFVLTTDSSAATGLKWSTGWTSYTPSWISSGTQPVLGNGTLTGSYLQIGKKVHVLIHFKAGSTTTFGTGVYQFGIPFTPQSLGSGAWGIICSAYCEDAGVNAYPVQSAFCPGGATIQPLTSAGTYLSPTVPFTWGTNDFFNLQATFGLA